MIRIWLPLGLVLGTGCASSSVSSSHAQRDPAIAGLENALPTGWTLMTTESELVIRRDQPCISNGEHLPNEPLGARPSLPPAGDPRIILELRYRLGPRWTDHQLADVRAANAKIYDEANALRTTFRIDAIRSPKGAPLPSNEDEETRLAAYTKANDQLLAHVVKPPLCSLGQVSVFDSDATYAQLRLEIDPPAAVREAFQIVELVKKRCGAT